MAYALTDLVGDRRPINQPGTHREYPNWSLALTGALMGVPAVIVFWLGLSHYGRAVAAGGVDVRR